MRWKEKKCVTRLSTIHNCEIIKVRKRQEIKKKTKTVVEYDDTMGGVDRVDQHLTNYPISKKSRQKVL